MGPTLRLRELRIEIAPSTCHWSSLRSVLPEKDFAKAARFAHNTSGLTCRICGRDGGYSQRLMDRVEIHEFWTYDDARLIRSLSGVSSVCPACHEVLHMPLALRKGRGSYALAHLKEVNGWDHQQALLHLSSALTTWEVRSRFEWQTDFGVLPQTTGWASVDEEPLMDMGFMQEQVAARSSARPMTRTLQLQADPVTPGYAHQENH